MGHTRATPDLPIRLMHQTVRRLPDLGRGIHLAMMGLIVAFVIIHVVLMAIYPRTPVSMVSGVPADQQTLP